MTYITKSDNTSSLNDFINETRSNDITTFWDDKLEENSNSRYAYKCCANCPNNPLNNPNASGFCYCILPTLESVRY